MLTGLMQSWPLTVDKILAHAKTWHGGREVVSRAIEGPISRTTYAEIHDRARRLSNALLALGIEPGERVATLAWNTNRHMEAWYAIMGIGAVCHTLNPRLFAEQLVYIINHAEDRIIFSDLSFVPILADILPRCPSVEHVILMTDEEHMVSRAGAARIAGKNVVCLERLVADHSSDVAWGGFDENTACGLCYTSGTTGHPKGVLYSHRSNFLLSLIGLRADVMGLSVHDVVLSIVPMFHANAWGVPFIAPAIGAKLVMPGAKLDGASIHELLETEGVTYSAAVPTVWQMLLQHLRQTGAPLTTLKRAAVGGSACPESLMQAFQDDYGVEVVHAWGMTETSPFGTMSAPTDTVAAMSPREQMRFKLKQGRPPLGVELKVTDDAGARLPWTSSAIGLLKVRGPCVARSYFRGEGNLLDTDGYFDSGDVAAIDEHGYMQITDRAKDVIKSGGEWISSIELENIAAGHPKAAATAVIGVHHPKWDERPLLLVQLKAGEHSAREEFLQFLQDKIAKWWTPDDVVFVDAIPLGPTGKIDKKLLRERFTDYRLPPAG